MALTMLRLKQFAMPFALAALVSGGVVFAQINPAVAKAAAQNAAQTASQSAGQSTSATSTKQPQTSATASPKKQTSTSATQTPAQHDKKPASPDTKATSTTKSTSDKKTTSDKKPATPASPAKTTQTQKTPPAKDVKKSGDVIRTTKPELPQGRRDPFIGLVGRQPGGANGPVIKLPPGKGGLQVSTVMLQGIVSGPNGMIAVVANPQKSVYFLRVGDELFDGRVEKIDIGSVTFHEVGKDAFGKPIEREVTKKLNPSSGDQP
jgi:hypothetical protein